LLPTPCPRRGESTVPDTFSALGDTTLLTALEALLNVLPAVPNLDKAPKLDANLAGASSDWDALEKLRRLAFSEQVPEPARQLLLPMTTTDEDHEPEED
jgi:hypothetical protein